MRGRTGDTRRFTDRIASTGAALATVLPWTARVRPWQVALTGFNVALINELLTDRLLLPRASKAAAAVGAGLSAGLVTLLTARALPGMRVGPLGVLAAAGAVGVQEYCLAQEREQETALEAYIPTLSGERAPEAAGQLVSEAPGAATAERTAQKPLTGTGLRPDRGARRAVVIRRTTP